MDKTNKQEAANPTTRVAHLYTLDHLVQSVFHYLFYYTYWFITPHDGRRTANSQAQQDLINLAASRGEIIDPATQETPGMDELRKALAGDIWKAEKVFAGWTLIAGFFLKVSRWSRFSLLSGCSVDPRHTSSSFCTRTPHTCDHRHTTPFPLPRDPRLLK
jgi:hypothetical protein